MGEGKRFHGQGSYRVRPRLRCGGLLPWSGTRREVCGGLVEGCLERIGEDHPEEELLFRDLFEDETQREVVIESLKADCEVRTGRPLG